MAFRWEVAPTDVFPQGYRNYTQTVMTTGRRVAQACAHEAEAWMKANAAWQVRTGKAWAGLHVDVNEAPAVIAELVFSHGVDYGIWLEIANGGRFAIIASALGYWGACV